jgi:hypothetical protein
VEILFRQNGKMQSIVQLHIGNECTVLEKWIGEIWIKAACAFPFSRAIADKKYLQIKDSFFLHVQKSHGKFALKSFGIVRFRKMNQKLKMETTTEIFKTIEQALKNGIKNPHASNARTWLKDKSLGIESTQAMYNSGQLHVGKQEEFKEALLRVGFIKRTLASHHNGVPYSCFGKRSVLFPLRNEENEVVNFCAMGIDTEKTEFLNKEGVYPCYPDFKIERLIITETVLDAATILESNILKEKEALMVIPFGQILEQHRLVIERSIHLKEIVYIIINQNYERFFKTN